MSKKYRYPVLSALAAVLFLFGCEQASIPTGVDDGAPAELDAGAAGLAPAQGRYVVVLNEDFAAGSHAANKARAAEVARGLGLVPSRTFGTAVFGFAAAIPEGRLRGLARDPRVAYVNVDAPVALPNPVRAQAPPWERGGGSDGQALPWGVDRIDADLNANAGDGVHVYILDSGVDADHPDLQAHLGDGYAVETCRGGGCATDWDDDHDHGTHVAGTVGALDNDVDVVGVAPGVTLHAVKVLNKRGSGSWSGIIAGIDWVARETAALGVPTVANMSLGGTGSKSGTCTSAGFTGSDAMHEAICNAARAGVVFAVAAGNEGDDAAAHVPAAYDDAVITVSATNASDQWESWSNWGEAAASWTAFASAPVALGAPGGAILSTKRGGGTTTMSGTSMASPHVAGALALFLASNAQGTDYSAFTNARAALLGAAEATGGFGNEAPANPHDEPFLDAEAF